MPCAVMRVLAARDIQADIKQVRAVLRAWRGQRDGICKARESRADFEAAAKEVEGEMLRFAYISLDGDVFKFVRYFPSVRRAEGRVWGPQGLVRG